MCRNIVGAFVGVYVNRIVFGYHFVDERFKIGAHRRVGIFVNGNSRRCMFHKNVK